MNEPDPDSAIVTVTVPAKHKMGRYFAEFDPGVRWGYCLECLEFYPDLEADDEICTYCGDVLLEAIILIKD